MEGKNIWGIHVEKFIYYSNQFLNFNLKGKVNSEEGSIDRQKTITKNVYIRQDCRFIIGGGLNTITKNTFVR